MIQLSSKYLVQEITVPEGEWYSIEGTVSRDGFGLCGHAWPVLGLYRGNGQFLNSPVPEFIDPVFTKTSPKRSFSLNRKRAFWLVFAKTGSIISGTG